MAAITTYGENASLGQAAVVVYAGDAGNNGMIMKTPQHNTTPADAATLNNILISSAGVSCDAITNLRNEHSMPVGAELIELHSTDMTTNYAGFEVIPINSTTVHVWLNLYSLDEGLMAPVAPRTPPRCTCCSPQTLWRVTNNNFATSSLKPGKSILNTNYDVLDYGCASSDSSISETLAASQRPRHRFRVNGSVVVQGLRGGEGPLLYVAASEGTFEFHLPNNAAFWYSVLTGVGAQLSRPSQIFALSPVRLGQGSFAGVVPCLHWPSGRPLAVKQLTRSAVLYNSGKVDSYRTEVDILRRLYHPFIVDFQAAFEEGGSLYVVLERLDGGTVWNYIHRHGPYTEDQARAAITRLLIALLALGAKGVVHRDIKPENVMLINPLDPTSVKLIDFGLAAYTSSSRMHMHCGSPGFVAPEVIQRRPYDSRADVFSIGVLLYVMITGTLPFASKGPVDRVLARNERCIFDLTHQNFHDTSHELKHFLAWTMQPDPTRRLSVRQAFMHPWIVGSIPQSDRVASLVRALNLGTWQSPQLAAIASHHSNTFHPVVTRLPLFAESRGTALEIVAKEFSRRITTFVAEAQPLIRAYHAAQRRHVPPSTSQTKLAKQRKIKRRTSNQSTTTGGTFKNSTGDSATSAAMAMLSLRGIYSVRTSDGQPSSSKRLAWNLATPTSSRVARDVKHDIAVLRAAIPKAATKSIYAMNERTATNTGKQFIMQCSATTTKLPLLEISLKTDDITSSAPSLGRDESTINVNNRTYNDDDEVTTPKQHTVHPASCAHTPKSTAKLSRQSDSQPFHSLLSRVDKRLSSRSSGETSSTTSPSLAPATASSSAIHDGGGDSSCSSFDGETPCRKSLGTMPFF